MKRLTKAKRSLGALKLLLRLNSWYKAVRLIFIVLQVILVVLSGSSAIKALSSER